MAFSINAFAATTYTSTYQTGWDFYSQAGVRYDNNTSSSVYFDEYINWAEVPSSSIWPVISVHYRVLDCVTGTDDDYSFNLPSNLVIDSGEWGLFYFGIDETFNSSHMRATVQSGIWGSSGSHAGWDIDFDGTTIDHDKAQ